jgi:hypothetical protein
MFFGDASRFSNSTFRFKKFSTFQFRLKIFLRSFNAVFFRKNDYFLEQQHQKNVG